MREIKLDLPENLTGLAGNKYGRKIYDEQVADKIGDFKDIIIIFPEQVTDVATSFLQGFFKRLVDVIGIEGINNNIKYKSKISNFENIVNTALMTMR